MHFYYKYEPLLHLNDSAYDVIALTGGRGSLKTGHVLRGVLTACMAEKKRVCFFRETRDTLSESLKAELDGLIDGEFSGRGYTYNKETVMYANGSYMFFKGLREVNNSSIENLKGIATSTDFFVVDEAQAVSKPVWDALIPTLRKKGCVLIVIYNRVDDKLPVEDCLFLDYETMSAPEKTFFLEVNYPEIEHLGILTEQFLARAELVKKNKPDEYRTIYLNQVQDKSRRAVVKYFSSDNVRKVDYDENEPIILTMDFNVDPMMWCVCHKNEKTLKCFDEIVIENCTTQDAADEFLTRYPAHKSDIILAGDASGNYRKTQSNLSDYMIVKNALMKHGYESTRIFQHTRPFNPPIKNRIRSFNSLVHGTDGLRRFYVDPKCKWLIHNMWNLAYKEGTSIIDLPTPSMLKADTESKFLGHIFDAISYPAEYYWPVSLEYPADAKEEEAGQFTMKTIIEKQLERKSKW